MDVEQFKDDVRSGRIDGDRLVELVVMLLGQWQQARDEAQQASGELRRAQQRIEELEKELGRRSPKLDEPFSVRAEEQRQETRGKKKRRKRTPKRRGRNRTAEKVALAERSEKIFPQGVSEQECRYSHTRSVWRLENGRAVLVAYEIHRAGNRFGKIPGVPDRGEFGIEISVAIAYQVYVIGLSFDKVCLLMNFFQGLTLTKSQADALLKRLARQWESEFDILCTLLAHSAVVHADETGWSINSVWAFLSEKVRVLFFGVHKDAATLQQILDPATFEGIVVSDDAAVYANFTHAQKCWAHLLRKAIKLTLLEPDNAEYREFTDRLLEIYREAGRVQRDRRLGDAGRARKVGELDDEIFELCGPLWSRELPPTDGPRNDYRLLVNELMRLMVDRELFTFVTAAPTEAPNGETQPVSGTNNEAERTLRAAAEARKTGRTSKTPAGARRRTVIVSVLESLRQHLPVLTLPTIIAEVLHWTTAGRSCFAKLLARLNLPPSRSSPLNLIPAAG
jgi:hypothetical protein